MSKTHILKTINPYFADLRDGRKKFEVRKNDRNFQIGDTLILEEYNKETQQKTGKEEIRYITYIYEDNVRLMGDYVVLELNDFDCEIVNDCFRVYDDVIDKHNEDRIVSYVLSHKDFPEGIREGYAVISFE